MSGDVIKFTSNNTAPLTAEENYTAADLRPDVWPIWWIPLYPLARWETQIVRLLSSSLRIVRRWRSFNPKKSSDRQSIKMPCSLGQVGSTSLGTTLFTDGQFMENVPWQYKTNWRSYPKKMWDGQMVGICLFPDEMDKWWGLFYPQTRVNFIPKMNRLLVSIYSQTWRDWQEIIFPARPCDMGRFWGWRNPQTRWNEQMVRWLYPRTRWKWH